MGTTAGSAQCTISFDQLLKLDGKGYGFPFILQSRDGTIQAIVAKNPQDPTTSIYTGDWH
jgi:hypothetical protein